MTFMSPATPNIEDVNVVSSSSVGAGLARTQTSLTAVQFVPDTGVFCSDSGDIQLTAGGVLRFVGWVTAQLTTDISPPRDTNHADDGTCSRRVDIEIAHHPLPSNTGQENGCVEACRAMILSPSPWRIWRSHPRS